MRIERGARLYSTPGRASRLKNLFKPLIPLARNLAKSFAIMSKVDELLKIAAGFGASDLHIKAGSFPFMRVGGELRPIVDNSRLSQEDTLDMAFSMMSNRQKQRFKEVSEVDIGY